MWLQAEPHSGTPCSFGKVGKLAEQILDIVIPRNGRIMPSKPARIVRATKEKSHETTVEVGGDRDRLMGMAQPVSALDGAASAPNRVGLGTVGSKNQLTVATIADTQHLHASLPQQLPDVPYLWMAQPIRVTTKPESTIKR